jgi:hypothetical protein
MIQDALKDMPGLWGVTRASWQPWFEDPIARSPIALYREKVKTCSHRKTQLDDCRPV